MQEIWKGPHTTGNDFLWYSFLPGGPYGIKSSRLAPFTIH